MGFPGETEADFADTLEVMREVKFAKVHMFPYSDRPRTRSALMPNKISHEVMRERKQAVLRMAEQTAYELRSAYVGRRMQVLTEKVPHADEASGHTANFLAVNIKEAGLSSNELVEVELVANTPEGLVGTLIRNSSSHAD